MQGLLSWPVSCEAYNKLCSFFWALISLSEKMWHLIRSSLTGFQAPDDKIKMLEIENFEYTKNTRSPLEGALLHFVSCQIASQVWR